MLCLFADRGCELANRVTILHTGLKGFGGWWLQGRARVEGCGRRLSASALLFQDLFELLAVEYAVGPGVEVACRRVFQALVRPGRDVPEA